MIGVAGMVQASRLLVTYLHVPIWITSGLPTIRSRYKIEC